MSETGRNRLKWIEALESGHYNQGRGYLCRRNKYCCLGVAAEILNLPKTPQPGSTEEETFTDPEEAQMTCALSPYTRRQLDLSLDQESRCISWNDKHRYSFSQIAAMLRQEFSLPKEERRIE